MAANETPFYTPAAPVRILLDTDIGPDCDDAGAAAVLHALDKDGEATIAGMMHCTSSKWGAGCLDALNAYYGRPDIPVGTLKTEGFLNDDAGYERYNKGITLNYPNRYKEEAAPDAVRLYRELLAKSEDQSTVIVAIGPLPNLMNLLQSEPDELSPLNGTELAARKVKHLVVMGGAFPRGKEWNFEMHPESASYVGAHWPTPITFTGFEIGLDIHTGSRLFTELPADHPVRQSYSWYVGEGKSRHSWDLTAVLYAARGAFPYWDLVRGRIEVDRVTGENAWQDDEAGPHAYLRALSSPESVAELLDELMVKHGG
ncbi:nucleoside hydrolase [Paenibacillus rhizovicinus]|uniref:Nucleoside hydrolase n=1 Tax=Paenibacillus rhizovicinus TaxID=2704463 RepID=A0A6C0NXG1_9BACL|nr:nucleoside hydrolase [Paenibacillus rhizovicinus]QHW30910.1 nucleoside hydrolase [Paenibacillus rhizovicinus]